MADSKNTSRQAKERQESGQSLVEFALVLMFIILPLVFGFIEGSVLLYKYVALSNAAREGARVMVVLNRAKAGTRVVADVDKALSELGVTRAEATLGHRVAFPETMGIGKVATERGKGAWTTEVGALRDEVLKRLKA